MLAYGLQIIVLLTFKSSPSVKVDKIYELVGQYILPSLHKTFNLITHLTWFFHFKWGDFDNDLNLLSILINHIVR
jgi:hypothetical protein